MLDGDTPFASPLSPLDLSTSPKPIFKHQVLVDSVF
jgi:hypothetical protein